MLYKYYLGDLGKQFSVRFARNGSTLWFSFGRFRIIVVLRVRVQLFHRYHCPLGKEMNISPSNLLVFSSIMGFAKNKLLF